MSAKKNTFAYLFEHIDVQPFDVAQTWALPSWSGILFERLLVLNDHDEEIITYKIITYLLRVEIPIKCESIKPLSYLSAQLLTTYHK